jgi:hypothetical protein
MLTFQALPQVFSVMIGGVNIILVVDLHVVQADLFLKIYTLAFGYLRIF